MGQQEIFSILKRQPGRLFTTTQLQRLVGLTRSSVNTSLLKLSKHGCIERLICITDQKLYYYRYMP